jgi:group I intron endonuclease
MGYYIYTIFNHINGKIYVGQTNDPKTRWNNHIWTAFSKKEKKQKKQYYIHKAIKKYGVDNFIFTIIQTLNNRAELNAAEKYWIKFFQSKNNEFGYNLTDGGDGCEGRMVSQETRNKIGKASKGHITTEETRKKISKTLTGVPLSPERREKLSITNKGHLVSEETRQKIREKATGRKRSKELAQKYIGENNVRSKLTLINIKDIRYGYNILGYKLIFLSKQFNISPRTIARVVYNIDWKDDNYIPPIPRKINHSGVSKLTQEKANQIRQMYSDGKTLKELSKLFGVTSENISLIIRGKIWTKNV